jgi:hypothetical protein
MRSALKGEGLGRNIFTETPDAVQSKVPWLLTLPRVTQNPFEEDCFAGVAKRPDHGPMGNHFYGTGKAPE